MECFQRYNMDIMKSTNQARTLVLSRQNVTESFTFQLLMYILASYAELTKTNKNEI